LLAFWFSGSEPKFAKLVACPAGAALRFPTKLRSDPENLQGFGSQKFGNRTPTPATPQPRNHPFKTRISWPTQNQFHCFQHLTGDASRRLPAGLSTGLMVPGLAGAGAERWGDGTHAAPQPVPGAAHCIDSLLRLSDKEN
jgi:hypothetical protein